METVAFKVVITPVLIAAATVVGRRWGPGVGGWVVGLPLTSAPVALFLALDEGRRFAALAATGMMAGAISQAAFALVYARVTVRAGPLASVLAASAAFALATAGLQALHVPLGVLFVAVALALGLALWLMPVETGDEAVAVRPPPRWDLAARMIVATACVLALTAAASRLGPRLTGLLAPFPLYATVLAVFADRASGAAGAGAVLRGLLLGLFGFAAFFLVLAVLLERAGITAAFAAALAAALVLQAASLPTLRRRSR